MPPHIPLGPKNANTCVQKKAKASEIELSPHKHSVIEGLYKASCSTISISEIENMPYFIVYNMIKFLSV
jgi:hypothetical protein